MGKHNTSVFLVDPAAPNCDTLVHSAVTVYLIHVVETMKWWGDSTHPCQCPTPKVNGRDLTFPTWTQISEQQYSDLTASNRRPSTPYSRNKLFTRNPVVCFLEVDKAYVDVFGILPTFLKNLLESEISSVVLRPGRKPVCVSFSIGSIILRHLFQDTWQGKCWITWKFPKSVAGRTKGPGGPHAARGSRVWDPVLNSHCYKAMTFLTVCNTR